MLSDPDPLVLSLSLSCLSRSERNTVNEKTTLTLLNRLSNLTADGQVQVRVVILIDLIIKLSNQRLLTSIAGS